VPPCRVVQWQPLGFFSKKTYFRGSYGSAQSLSNLGGAAWLRKSTCHFDGSGFAVMFDFDKLNEFGRQNDGLIQMLHTYQHHKQYQQAAENHRAAQAQMEELRRINEEGNQLLRQQNALAEQQLRMAQEREALENRKQEEVKVFRKMLTHADELLHQLSQD
jgi:hypothetical protein